MKVIKNWFDINKKISTHYYIMNNKEKWKIYILNYTNIFLIKNFTYNFRIIVVILIILIKENFALN